MELDQYLELVRDAELHAKAAGSREDAEAWLQIAEAWRRTATLHVESGGVARSNPCEDQAVRLCLRTGTKVPLRN